MKKGYDVIGVSVFLRKLLGSLSNSDGDGDGYENVSWIRAAWTFIALIPSRSIRQMLALFSEVEF